MPRRRRGGGATARRIAQGRPCAAVQRLGAVGLSAVVGLSVCGGAMGVLGCRVDRVGAERGGGDGRGRLDDGGDGAAGWAVS
jgi:hypothetical protein